MLPHRPQTMPMPIKLILISLVSLIMFGCAAPGSIIITGAPKSAIDPSMVKLYFAEPHKYEVLGFVEATGKYGVTRQDKTDEAIKKVKEMAASIGANGILITNFNDITGGTVGVFMRPGIISSIPSNWPQIYGKAIFVIEETVP